jgi:hypothetical protein
VAGTRDQPECTSSTVIELTWAHTVDVFVRVSIILKSSAFDARSLHFDLEDESEEEPDKAELHRV